MKVLSFLSHEDLAEFMIEMALDEGKTSYAVLFYEDARQLLKELSAYEETIIDSFDCRASDDRFGHRGARLGRLRL